MILRETLSCITRKASSLTEGVPFILIATTWFILKCIIVGADLETPRRFKWNPLPFEKCLDFFVHFDCITLINLNGNQVQCLQYVFHSLLSLQKHRVWVKGNQNNRHTTRILPCPRFWNFLIHHWSITSLVSYIVK